MANDFISDACIMKPPQKLLNHRVWGDSRMVNTSMC